MVLVLKVVREDMTSHNGFKWPDAGGEVKPEKWDPTATCGNGLHGWLAGTGMYRHSFMAGTWVVFEASSVVSLDGGDKCKAPDARVVFVGSQADAVKFLVDKGALTQEMNPGWCCFSDEQLRVLAYRAATRAVKKYAPARLRRRGYEERAVRLEALPDITDQKSAAAATAAAYAAAYDAASDAADAAAHAAAASDAADAAAATAAYAADAARATTATAAYAADAAAANAATDAADAAAAAEREAQRLDRLELLGFSVR